ncbi:MAG: Uma2 family endonuclease [Lachnospiraceae bacterium]
MVIMVDEIRKLKERRGYSVAQLSRYSGVPVGTIQKILSGATKQPRQATLLALQQVLTGREEDYDGKSIQYAMQASTDGVRETAKHSQGIRKKSLDSHNAGQNCQRTEEDERCELIDGKLYDMGCPSLLHQELVHFLDLKISEYILRHRGKCRVYEGPVAVRMEDSDQFELVPDLLVLCDLTKRNKWGVLGGPDLVLEVSSASTKKRDTGIKLSTYMNMGVREYWILNPEQRILMIHHFESEEYVPEVIPLVGDTYVRIFGEECSISLDELRKIIEEE